MVHRGTFPAGASRAGSGRPLRVSCGGSSIRNISQPGTLLNWEHSQPGQSEGAMDRIRISGGHKLNGSIPISGAKNATLPLMIASLLTDETLILENVPRLADVALLQRILGNHGVDVMVGGKRPGETQYDGQTLHISAANIIDTTAPYELVSRM